MSYFLAAAIALIALILVPGFSFSFDVVPKVAVLIAAAGFTSLTIRRSRLMWLVVASAASLIVSACLSSNPELSWYGSAWRRYGAIAQIATFLLAWAVAAQTRNISSMLKIISAAGLITALYGIAQYLGWDPILPAASYHIGEGVWTIVRPPSTLGYSSYFATWLLFIVFLSFDLPQWPGRFIAAICVVAMLLTGTRAAMLGLIAGVIVWLFWRGVRIPRKAIAIAGAVIAAVVAFYFSPPGQMVRARARWFREDPWGGARLLLWRDSARMALAHPVFGFGPETFTANFPHYESRELARAYPDFAHESPHNIFLDAFCAQGLPGLLLALAWCAAGFASAWRIRGKHPMAAAGLAGALAAGAASQLFTAFTVPTAVIFFATVALADGLESGAAPPRRYIPLFAPLLYFAVRYIYLDHELALTQHAIAARDLTSAASHYAASRNGDDLWYSRELLSVAGTAPTIPQRLTAMQQASIAGERATRTAEAPSNAWYSLSQLRASQGNAAGMESALRSAIAAHPNWFKPHWTLAQLMLLQHRVPEARAEAQTAVDLDAGKYPEVSRTLQEANRL